MKTLFNETGFSFTPRLMKMKSKHLLKPNFSAKKIFLSFLLLFSINIIIHAQFVQQAPKLVGTEYSGTPNQSTSVALSADGNTAIVGGSGDNNFIGAAWVFTRNGGAWRQQGGKLVGAGYIGSEILQSQAVALSADGNTAIVGGEGDNGFIGASWIFTRSGGPWTQQGGKLVGTGYIGSSVQGHSVAISADGNTAIVGGWGDNNIRGAAWIFTRNGEAWTQQGGKLVGSGSSGAAFQGTSVALSADGNTAIVGGDYGSSGIGASWVFTRSGETWTQQGGKLVGTGHSGNSDQGHSVTLSADGNTAIVGGWQDNSGIGATWIFTRNGGTWTQQGGKLVGTGYIGASQQGSSVSLSADGNTALVGGVSDNGGLGAAWVFTRSGGTWTQLGAKLVGTGSIGASGQGSQGKGVSLSADATTAIVGGPYDNNGIGAAWVYVSALSQATLTLQSNEEKCNYVSSHFRSNVQVDSLGFTASRYPGGLGNLRGFLQFDLSFIPAGSKVNWARLSLFALPNGTTGANSSKLRRVTSAWDPNTVTWNNQPTTTKRGQVSLATSTSNTEDYKNLNVTNLVQAMVDSPFTSFGFALKLDTENGTDPVRMQFYAPANGKLHRDPKLVLEYTPPGSMKPEVTTLSADLKGSSTEMNIYPNPSSGAFSCNIKSSVADNMFLKVIDVFGRTIYSQPVNSSNLQMRIKLASTGMYLVILRDDKNETIVSQKVVVN